MKKFILLSFHFLAASVCLLGQSDSAINYKVTRVMIPMRDGTKLFTLIMSPAEMKEPGPILMERTPYGADIGGKDSLSLSFDVKEPYYAMAKDGYIFIFQDIRGKSKSEGKMEIHQPLIHASNPHAVDESTDTWDAVDWLVKNVPNNNGKVGITGVSYPGWLTLVGSVDPHPALRAASEQACMGDLFLGDDFHHNGAFRLSYGFEYSYGVENDPATYSDFPFAQFDQFDWYLHLGRLSDVNAKYFHNKVPTWNHFVEHPNYDSFWKRNSTLSYVNYPQIPQLHVGGYFDQEDLNGPQLMYEHMEKKDSFSRNHIVLGPWFHGQWAFAKGDSLGKISFGSKTGEWFRILQKKWFDYWLRGIGDGKFEEAYTFQTGSNQWKTYSSWPPKEAMIRNLYAVPNQKASFIKPVSLTGYVSFISDPWKPVPYRQLPIEATYGHGSHWRDWQIQDQRFVYARPDVVSFATDTLVEDLTVTGRITAHLFASTSANDADWIIKLIDVYPDLDTSNYLLSGYQLPIAMEVFRGRFRKNYSDPQPLTPGKPEEFIINLHTINHRFKKGHRLMMQVQSTWFPVIDRNPQKWVPNIFQARESDYIKAEHKIYFSSALPTHIELPVMNE